MPRRSVPREFSGPLAGTVHSPAGLGDRQLVRGPSSSVRRGGAVSAPRGETDVQPDGGVDVALARECSGTSFRVVTGAVPPSGGSGPRPRFSSPASDFPSGGRVPEARPSFGSGV